VNVSHTGQIDERQAAATPAGGGGGGGGGGVVYGLGANVDTGFKPSGGARSTQRTSKGGGGEGGVGGEEGRAAGGRGGSFRFLDVLYSDNDSQNISLNIDFEPGWSNILT
jgi:hypothetical protein